MTKGGFLFSNKFECVFFFSSVDFSRAKKKETNQTNRVSYHATVLVDIKGAGQ